MTAPRSACGSRSKGVGPQVHRGSIAAESLRDALIGPGAQRALILQRQSSFELIVLEGARHPQAVSRLAVSRAWRRTTTSKNSPRITDCQ